MKRYRVTSGKLDIMVEGANRKEAIQNFFKLVKIFWKSWRSKLAQIAILHDNEEEYAFRLVPSLFNLGLIDEQTAIQNLLLVFGEAPTPTNLMEARIMLHRLAAEDKWMTQSRNIQI